MIKVQAARFGEIEIGEESIIRIPRGILGFEDAKEFALIQHKPGSAIRWLQCLTDPELAFAVIDPSEYFEDYDFELSATEVEYLGITRPDQALVLTIISIGSQGKEVTANLVGPVVVNSKTLVGMQVVLDDPKYGTRHKLTGRTDSGAKDALVRAA